jgi:hypothetical protein
VTPECRSPHTADQILRNGSLFVEGRGKWLITDSSQDMAVSRHLLDEMFVKSIQ